MPFCRDSLTRKMAPATAAAWTAPAPGPVTAKVQVRGRHHLLTQQDYSFDPADDVVGVPRALVLLHKGRSGLQTDPEVSDCMESEHTGAHPPLRGFTSYAAVKAVCLGLARPLGHSQSSSPASSILSCGATHDLWIVTTEAFSCVSVVLQEVQDRATEKLPRSQQKASSKGAAPKPQVCCTLSLTDTQGPSQCVW